MTYSFSESPYGSAAVEAGAPAGAAWRRARRAICRLVIVPALIAAGAVFTAMGTIDLTVMAVRLNSAEPTRATVVGTTVQCQLNLLQGDVRRKAVLPCNEASIRAGTSTGATYQGHKVLGVEQTPAVRVRYHTADGMLVDAAIDTLLFGRVRPELGDRVSIFYRKNNPQNAIPGLTWSSLGAATHDALTGGLMLTLALLMRMLLVRPSFRPGTAATALRRRMLAGLQAQRLGHDSQPLLLPYEPTGGMAG